MGDLVTWETLGKNINDNQTIDEEIGALILTHNMDPSAHGQTSESVYEHRVASELDHAPYSIYSISGNPATRVYRAIVAPGLASEFATIQAAIEWAHLYGGGTVFIKAGTYQLTDPITLYSNITLRGEGPNLTILDFQHNLAGIQIWGTSGEHVQNVVVADLAVIQASPSEYGAIWCEYADNVTIQNVLLDDIVAGSGETPWCISFDYCTNGTVDHCTMQNSTWGIAIWDSEYFKIEFNTIRDMAQWGANFWNAPYISFRHNLCDGQVNEGGDGYIHLPGGTNDLVIDSNFFLGMRSNTIWSEGGSRISVTNNIMEGVGTDGNGIALDSEDYSVIANNRISGFPWNGIDINYDANRNTITGNVIYSNTLYGISIDDATDDKNVVVGNSLYNNGSGAIYDVGTGTVKTGNSS